MTKLCAIIMITLWKQSKYFIITNFIVHTKPTYLKVIKMNNNTNIPITE